MRRFADNADNNNPIFLPPMLTKTSLSAIRTLSEGEVSPPGDIENIAAVLDRQCNRTALTSALIDGCLLLAPRHPDD